jgi:hypothetical protein
MDQEPNRESPYATRQELYMLVGVCFTFLGFLQHAVVPLVGRLGTISALLSWLFASYCFHVSMRELRRQQKASITSNIPQK